MEQTALSNVPYSEFESTGSRVPALSEDFNASFSGKMKKAEEASYLFKYICLAQVT
jgi:hypothetical protein